MPIAGGFTAPIPGTSSATANQAAASGATVTTTATSNTDAQ